MRGARNMVGVCAAGAIPAACAVLLACGAASAEITASLDYPGMRPAWRDARADRVLAPHARAASPENLNATLFLPIDTERFEPDAGPALAAARADGRAAKPAPAPWAAAIESGLGTLPIDDDAGRTAGPILLLGGQSPQAADPFPGAAPPPALGPGDLSSVLVVRY